MTHSSTQSKSPFQVEIPRRAPNCTHCEGPFVKGEEYYSMILDGVAEGTFERRDYCMKCAGELLKTDEFRPHAGKGISLWKSAIPPQKEPSDLPKQRDARALVLLKEALAANNPALDAEAFVLALYLARRRRIYQRQEIKLPSGKEAIIFEVAHTEEMLGVPKFELSLLQVETVQAALAAKLK